MSGWIKLHRSVLEHWVYQDPAYLKAWITILLTVNYEPKKVLIRHSIIECGKGQSVISLHSWVEKFGVNHWSIRKVRTFFDLLQNDNMITLENLKKTTRLTVCNYDRYQEQRHADDTQTTRRRHADDTPTTTTKEREERKEEEEQTPQPKADEVLSPKIDYDKIINSFHSFCPGLPKVKIVNDSRKNKIRARVKESGEDVLFDVFRKAGESDFLNGKGERQWKADFEWIINPTNFVKILEGRYENKQKSKKREPLFYK